MACETAVKERHLSLVRLCTRVVERLTVRKDINNYGAGGGNMLKSYRSSSNLPKGKRISKQSEYRACRPPISPNSGYSEATGSGSRVRKRTVSSTGKINDPSVSEPTCQNISRTLSFRHLKLPPELSMTPGEAKRMTRKGQSSIVQALNKSMASSSVRPDRLIYEVLKSEVGKRLADYIAKGFEWQI